MEVDEALALLGVEVRSSDGTVSVTEVRAAFRRAVRTSHPDLTGPTGTAATASAIDAFRTLRARADDDGTIAVGPARAAPRVAGPMHAGQATDRDTTPTASAPVPSPVVLLDDATIALGLPGPDAFATLYEAAGDVGEVSYVDRQLGILEIVVRFEGGPSCSVVMTLQGRALYTEVFCTMESIEAAPAPPIDPVLEALVAALGDALGPDGGSPAGARAG